MYAVTKASGQMVSSLDVCKTPAPSGTVTVPYPNVGSPPLGLPAAAKVLIGGMPALNRNSKCVPSSGDEGGTLGGVASGVFKGEAGFVGSSLKVVIQGAPAVRLNDATLHNQNNAAGSVAAPSQTVVQILS